MVLLPMLTCAGLMQAQHKPCLLYTSAMFDQYLTDLGGAVINAAADTGNGESYWASTESEDGQKARYVRFGKYGFDFGAKTGTSRFVRAMKVIGNYKFPEEPATLTVTPTQVGLTSEAGATAESTVTTNKSSYTVTIEGEDVYKRQLPCLRAG